MPSNRKTIDPFPRFPSDPDQLIRKLTDLHRDIAEVVNRGVLGQIDLLADTNDVGLVLKSPDGNYWRVSVTNAGALTTTSLGTVRP